MRQTSNPCPSCASKVLISSAVPSFARAASRTGVMVPSTSIKKTVICLARLANAAGILFAASSQDESSCVHEPVATTSTPASTNHADERRPRLLCDFIHDHDRSNFALSPSNSAPRWPARWRDRLRAAGHAVARRSFREWRRDVFPSVVANLRRSRIPARRPSVSVYGGHAQTLLALIS